MVVYDADRSLASAQFWRELQPEPLCPKVLARRKSVGILLYLFSLGLVVISTIGIFFGTGFFLLVHQAGEMVPGSSPSLPVGTVPIGIADRDQPGVPDVIMGIEGQSLAMPKGIDQHGVNGERPAHSLEFGTLRLAGDIEQGLPLPQVPFDATGPDSVTQLAHLVPSRELGSRRPPETRTRRSPVSGLAAATLKRKSGPERRAPAAKSPHP